jgi:hypothetical protein
MTISNAVFVVTLVISPALFSSAQSTATGTSTGSGTSSAANYFTPSAPSDILQRALDEVKITVGGVRLEKWKRGTVRDEAGTNIDAIQRDLQGTLPGLLRDADAAPGSLTKVLPLSRNVDALYDVMVHVVEGARVVGTSDQVGQLQTALSDLEKARVSLDNQIQQTADMQEKQMVDLRSTVQKQDASLRTAATPPPAPKCPAPPTPAKRKRRSTSSTAKPAASGSSNTTTKPQ